MPDVRYQNFDLTIQKDGEEYRSKVDSPAGQASGRFSVPFSDLELENFVLTTTPGRRSVRRIDTPEVAAAKRFGERLFNSIFTGEVMGRFHSALNDAFHSEARVRIRLRLTDVPELADLPWEYLYNPALNRFLALDDDTAVVRYLELPERVRPVMVTLPLKVLVAISNASDYPRLDVEQEWANLNEALGGLERAGLLNLDLLEDVTLGGLRRQLSKGQYHVFHFIGHGGFDRQTEEGVLVLRDEQGRGRLVSGQQLGWLLRNHKTLALAVLNACEGARADRMDVFAGTAQSLVQQGIPAVVAMQREITDDAAKTFAHAFYTAVADGRPVEAAMTETRLAIFAEGHGLEWATPVLYMRAPDGRVFDLHAPVAMKPGEPPVLTGHEHLLLKARADTVAEPEQEVVKAYEAKAPSVGVEAQPPTLADILPKAEAQTSTGDPAGEATQTTMESEPTVVREVEEARPKPQSPDAQGQSGADMHTDIISGTHNLIQPMLEGVAQTVLKETVAASRQTAAEELAQSANRMSGHTVRVLPKARTIEAQTTDAGRRRLWLATAAVGVVAVLAVLIWTVQAVGSPSANTPQATATVPTSAVEASGSQATATVLASAGAGGFVPAGELAPPTSISGTVSIDMLHFSPDGKALAVWFYTGSGAQETNMGQISASAVNLRSWGYTDWVVEGYDRAHPDMSYSLDGETLAITKSGGVEVRSMYDQRLVSAAALPNAQSIALSRDGKTLAGGAAIGVVALWDSNDSQQLRYLAGHRGDVESVAFSPLGDVLATTEFGETRIWDVQTGAFQYAITHSLGNVPGTMKSMFAHDGKTIVVCSSEADCGFWRLSDGEYIGSLESEIDKSSLGKLLAFGFSADDQTFATGWEDGVVQIWKDGGLVDTQRLSIGAEKVSAMAFSSDLSLVALGLVNGVVQIWRME